MADCCTCKAKENLHTCDFCDYIYCNACGSEDAEFLKWLCIHCQSLKKEILQCGSCRYLFFCDDMNICSCDGSSCILQINICIECSIYCLKCRKHYYKNCPLVHGYNILPPINSFNMKSIKECGKCKE